MSIQIEQFTKAPNPLDDQEVFDVDMATYVTETLRFVTQANALGQEMQINADVAAALILAMALPQFAGTSTSSVTVGTGARTFTTQAGKGWLPGQIVVASSGANYVKGTVTAYTGTDLALNVTSINGSGTYSAWSIGLSYDGLALANSGVNSDITELLGLLKGVSGRGLGRKLQPLTATAASGAMTITLDPTTLDFRSTTLATGGATTVSNSSALALTVPNTTSLGAATANGTQRLPVLAINNAGTMELALGNYAGGAAFDEAGLVTTVAIGSASAFTSIGAAAARTSVAYVVVGWVDALFTTGTGWTISQVQAAGATPPPQSNGPWQSVTRNAGADYYNTSGRDKKLWIQHSGQSVSYATLFVTITQNGASITLYGTATASGSIRASMCVDIPAGAKYSWGIDSGTMTSPVTFER